MGGRRSSRQDSVPSALGLLDGLGPAHHAITRALAQVRVGGPVWTALDAVAGTLSRLAAALGHPGHFAATDHLNVVRRASPILHEPECAAMPSMPDRSTFDVVEEDEGGTYAVIWSGTGRVAVWNGAPQRGLTIDEADDAADCMEALDRIAASREPRRLDG